MQIPQIRTHQTYAQIGLRTSQPVQEIEQPPAEMSIQQVPAQMTIDHVPAKLEIDQDQARYEYNMKTPSAFSRDYAEEGKQAALEAAGEIAQEGDQLAAIENKGNPIVSMAADVANPPPADFNIAFIPSYGSVHIQFTPGKVNIDWKLGGAEIHTTQHKPILGYTPWKTEVYMRQMQQLDIDFIGINVNSKS